MDWIFPASSPSRGGKVTPPGMSTVGRSRIAVSAAAPSAARVAIGWYARAAEAAQRLPPLHRRRRVLASRVEREPEVEAHEAGGGYPLGQRAELRDGFVRPGGDRGAHSRLERVGILSQKRFELRTRSGRVALVVGPLGGAKLFRLAVGSKREPELERGRSAVCARCRRGIVIAPHERGADGDAGCGQSGRSDEQAHARAWRHASSLAAPPRPEAAGCYIR